MAVLAEVDMLLALNNADVLRREIQGTRVGDLVERLELVFEHQNGRVQVLLDVDGAENVLSCRVLKLYLIADNLFVFFQVTERVLDLLDGCQVALP